MSKLNTDIPETYRNSEVSQTKAKKIQITIDVLLFLALILAFFSLDTFPITAHVILGLLFTALFIIHFRLNIKWFQAAAKAVKAKSANKKVKRRYHMNLLMLVIWSLVALAGILHLFTGATVSHALFIHIRLALLGTILIIIHLVQHRSQIRVYFANRKKGSVS